MNKPGVGAGVPPGGLSDVAAPVMIQRRRGAPRTGGFGDFWRVRSTRRLRARRVRRLIRHIEPWSVLKVSLLLYFCIWAVNLLVGVTLWQLAFNAGLIANVENFITKLGALESFKIHGDMIFQIAAAGGLILVMALTGLTVLGSVLFNLISDVTGGVRVTVVEEETARQRVRKTRRQVAQKPGGRKRVRVARGVAPGSVSGSAQ